MRRLFGNAELVDLDEATLAAALAEAGAVTVGAASPLVDVLVETGLVDSKSAARRAIAEGGAYLNNVKITDPDRVLQAADLLHGSWVVVRRGKRSVRGCRVERLSATRVDLTRAVAPHKLRAVPGRNGRRWRPVPGLIPDHLPARRLLRRRAVVDGHVEQSGRTGGAEWFDTTDALG